MVGPNLTKWAHLIELAHWRQTSKTWLVVTRITYAFALFFLLSTNCIICNMERNWISLLLLLYMKMGLWTPF